MKGRKRHYDWEVLKQTKQGCKKRTEGDAWGWEAGSVGVV